MLSKQEIIAQQPKKPATLKQWKQVYTDKLQGLDTAELAEKYSYNRERIRQIIRFMVAYSDYDLETNEHTVIAKHKTQSRIKFLRSEVEKIQNSFKIDATEKAKLTLAYAKEIRVNNELVHKLDGILKPDIGKYIDNRKIIIKHNIGNTTEAKKIDTSKKIIEPNFKKVN
jgi:hypothetical protein